MTNVEHRPARLDGAAMKDVVRRIAERAPIHDRDGSFPHEAFDVLSEYGLLNLTVPPELGGGGAGLAEVCRVVETVATADPSVALVLFQHLMLHASLQRDARWPAALKERLQRSSLEGVALVNALRVEPELGTPSRGGLPATVATRVADGWSISGHKIYCTGIPRLSWLLVTARTDDADPLVGTFVVPAGTPGYRVVETWDHLGMRATRSDDVIFEGAIIPAENVVGLAPAGGGQPVDPSGQVWNNLIVASIYNGVAIAARDWLVRYLHERKPSNLGASLATLPRFQSEVGEIETLLHVSSRLIHGAAAGVDAGLPDASQGTAMVKLTGTNNAIKAVEIAIALIGNPGLSRANPLERHLRDVLCSRIHTPQDDVILGTAGRSALAAAAPREA